MKKTLDIALVEFDIAWEDPEQNYTQIESLIKDINSDLIVLPEMFASGFSMNVENIAESTFGTSYQWMKRVSEEKKAAICGSISTNQKELFYNRFYFVNGSDVVIYDKRHLFGYGQETDVYTAGNDIVEFNFSGWKVRPIVCYDLRFPVWCRNTTDYDLLLCVANWPEQRIEAWETLLKARAIENMAYTVGVNRLGEDGYGLKYNGDSCAFDVLGRRLDSGEAGLKVITLSGKSILENRKKFGFLEDRDMFRM